MTINNRRTLIFMAGFILFFVVLIFGPFYSINAVNRVRTSFKFSDDESMNVRDQNRKMIQPYIYSHPLGGGVATSGVLGLLYNPGHPLAGFPPDSGYLRAAIETGPIGLAYTLFMFFVMLQVGIRNYYASRSKKTRTIYVGHVCVYDCAICAGGDRPDAGCLFLLWRYGHHRKTQKFRTKPHKQSLLKIKTKTT
jgi:hypothetical protein